VYGIALRYGARGEVRFVAVVGANRNSTLEVAWPMTTPYAVHLKRNCLLRSPSARYPVGVWEVVDLSFAWRIWWELAGHLVQRPLHVLGATAEPRRWEPLRKKKPPP